MRIYSHFSNTATLGVLVVLMSTVLFIRSVKAEALDTTLDETTVPNMKISSGEQQVVLLELYSSQGCSSCPPAEKWINRFVDEPQLWQSLVPVVFHVDYWDYLGWKDPYSHPAFTARQGEFKKQGLSRSVYTPGFIVNGREWRGWFQGRDLPKLAPMAGNLEVTLKGEKVAAAYNNFKPGQVLNLAILGFGLNTHINAGENRRKTLRQEFVVLNFKQIKGHQNGWQGEWQLPKQPAARYGISAWVTNGKSLKPVQATGGFLSGSVIQWMRANGHVGSRQF